MPDLYEIKAAIDNCAERLTALEAALKIADKRAAAAALDEKAAAPDFWNDPENAQKVVQERKTLLAVLEPFDKVNQGFKDARELWELARAENDAATEA